MLIQKYKEDMKNLGDMIAAAPSAINVDLCLDHPSQTIVLRDLLQLFKIFCQEKEPCDDTAVLAITVSKLKVVNLSDLKGIKASDWIQQGVVKYLSEESGCEISLDIRDEMALVRVRRAETSSIMLVTIQGDKTQGDHVYLELF